MEVGAFAWIGKQGKPLTHYGVKEVFLRLFEKAGIGGKKAGPYAIRHTFATWYLRNGGGVRQLQEILGHQSIETTMIYVHLAGLDIQADHARLIRRSRRWDCWGSWGKAITGGLKDRRLFVPKGGEVGVGWLDLVEDGILSYKNLLAVHRSPYKDRVDPWAMLSKNLTQIGVESKPVDRDLPPLGSNPGTRLDERFQRCRPGQPM